MAKSAHQSTRQQIRSTQVDNGSAGCHRIGTCCRLSLRMESKQTASVTVRLDVPVYSCDSNDIRSPSLRNSTHSRLAETGCRTSNQLLSNMFANSSRVNRCGNFFVVRIARSFPALVVSLRSVWTRQFHRALRRPSIHVYSIGVRI